MARDRMRAFTLIELLVVILIITVVSAVIVPAYSGFYDKARFDAQVRRVQDYFALAHERAVAGDINVTLHFEHSSDVFTIQADPLPQQNDLPTALLTASAGNQSQEQDVLPLEFSADYRVENFVASGAASSMNGPRGATQSDIQFRGDGTCDGAEFDIMSRQGLGAHLVLSPMTGRLTLEAQPGRGQR